MKHLFPLGFLLGLLLAASCTDDDDTGSDSTSVGGSAGSSAGGSAGSQSGSGGSAQAGQGGSSSGAGGSSAGSGGSSAGSGGSASGAGGQGGSSAGSAGSVSGAGGSAAGSAGSAGSGGSAGSAGGDASLSFFVSSMGNATANLGGLAGADKRCLDLAAAVGAGAKTWHAYLSVEKGPDGGPVHAKDRIGKGPWYNAKLVMVAADLTSLHERFGDAEVFLDEHGEKIPGQWAGSPSPVQHDVLTGSKRDGTLEPGKTCADWTSEDTSMTAIVGHTDGLGPNMSMDAMYRPWNAVHENGSCADTAPKGGNGRIYCFAAD